MNIRIWCSLTLALLAGCGGGSAPLSERPMDVPQNAPRDTLAETIFSLAQDTVLSPLVQSWPDEYAPPGDTGSPGPVDEVQAVPMIYRVQIFTTKDLATAQTVKDEAFTDFGEEVHLDFEVPYYKVRVGEFSTAQEAESLLQEARRLGYRGAWAVRLRAPEAKR